MNKKLLFKFLSLVVVLLICTFIISCAIVYPIGGIETSTKKRLHFIDARPDFEKRFRPSSKKSEPIHRFGDENFQPDRMMILEQALQKHLNDSFSGSTAKITKFEVFAFFPKAREMSFGYSRENFEIMFGPVFGPALYEVIRGTKGKDFFGCQIEGDIDGKKFIAFSQEEFVGLVDTGSAKRAVNILLNRTIDMVVDNINSSAN